MVVYDYLIMTENAILLDKEESSLVISQFIENFVDLKKVSENILLWNSLKNTVITKRTGIDYEKLKELDFDFPNKVFAYLERYKEVFETNLNEILESLRQREPWEEDDDVVAFDNEFSWFYVFTHESEIIEGHKKLLGGDKLE